MNWKHLFLIHKHSHNVTAPKLHYSSVECVYFNKYQKLFEKHAMLIKKCWHDNLRDSLIDFCLFKKSLKIM